MTTEFLAAVRASLERLIARGLVHRPVMVIDRAAMAHREAWRRAYAARPEVRARNRRQAREWRAKQKARR